MSRRAIRLLLSVTALIVAGCSAAPQPQVATTTTTTIAAATEGREPCRGELERIVLGKVQSRIGGLYGHPHQKQRELIRIRKWAQGLSDKCVQDAYERWLDFFDKELAHEFAEERREQAEQKYAHTHRIPEPPE